MNLRQLIEFCEKHDIDPRAVTFSYGHKEVVACFPFVSIPCFAGLSLEDVLEQDDGQEYEKYPILKTIYFSSNYDSFVLNIW